MENYQREAFEEAFNNISASEDTDTISDEEFIMRVFDKAEKLMDEKEKALFKMLSDI